MILVILIENGHFGPLFEDPLTASCPKVTIYLPFTQRTLSGPAQNPVIFWPNFDHFGPLWGSWREAAARPLTSCLWAGGPVWTSQTHAQDLKFYYLDHFSYWKVNFGHFAYQGQWNAILTLFWPILSPPEPKFWPWTKCAYLFPLPGWTLGGTLRDPKFDLYFDHLDPFEGPWGRLWLGPLQAAFWAGGPVWTSQTHAWNLKFWSFWPLWTSCETSKMTSFWTIWPLNLTTWWFALSR